MIRQRVDLDRAGDAAVALFDDRGDTGMLEQSSVPVDLLGLEHDVLLEDLLDGDAAEVLAFVEESATTSPTEHSRSVARVIGIGQYWPSEVRICAQTFRQSSEP